MQNAAKAGMNMENELMLNETRDRIVPRVAVLLSFLLSLSLSSWIQRRFVCVFTDDQRSFKFLERPNMALTSWSKSYDLLVFTIKLIL